MQLESLLERTDIPPDVRQTIKRGIDELRESEDRLRAFLDSVTDAFALWDSDEIAYNSMDMGPKRDIVSEFCTAARKAGIRTAWEFEP